jgi:hypothetical protein
MTGRQIHFETVDAMRVHNGKITKHWGVANLLPLMQQLGAWPPATDESVEASPKTSALERSKGHVNRDE